MERGRRRRRGDRIIRHPRQQELTPLRIPAPTPRQPGRKFESPLVLLFGLGSLIAIGTTLLWLPFFNTTGGFTPFLTALFTATSAITCTGLVIMDTATFWNRAGQGVIMALIFVGGLGFMSAATFLLVIITQRISIANQLIMREFVGVRYLGGLARLAIQIASVSLILQLAGAALFLWRLLPLFNPGQALWQATFLSVSAFNNAGFSIVPDSDNLTRFQGELWILGTVAALIILGGISYSVVADIVRNRRFKRFTLDTRLVLVVSMILWVVGGLVIFASEFNNADTLRSLPMGERVANSFFTSVTPRTAGFNTIDFSRTELHTNIFITGLMFIGAASGSTAGGIKVNTLAVLLVAVMASIQGKAQATVFGREIPASQIQRALAVAFLSISFVFFVAFLLVMTERIPFDRLLFETVSAFGTVGLSTGITHVLSPWGKTLILITMFIGKIGPLTIALALAQRQQHAIYRYSQERVRIG